MPDEQGNTQARIGYGSSFWVASTYDPEASPAFDADSSPDPYTKVSEVVGITPPSEEIDLIDATHMESPNRYREYIPGLRDGGEVEIEMNFIPGGTVHQLIRTVQALNYAFPCRIEFPNGAALRFFAFCTGFEPEVPVDDKMMATATFKVTGATTLVDTPE